MSTPEFPGVSSPSVLFYSAVKIAGRITRFFSSVALKPIHCIYLPKPDIGRAIWVVIDCIRISSALMRNDAFAASLTPTIL